MRKGTMTAARIGTEAAVPSWAPAVNVTTQPMARAGLFGASAGGRPPVTPRTPSAPGGSRAQRPVVIQAIQAAPQTARVAAMAVPRGPGVAGPGLKKQMLTM